MPVHSTVNGSKVVFTIVNAVVSTSEITIYNAAGKTVAWLSRVNAGAKGGSLVWDCSRVGNGVYFYHMKVNGRLITGSVAAGVR